MGVSNWSVEQYREYLKSGTAPGAKKKNKYNAVKTNGYDSKHEADIAAELKLKALAENITILEQVNFKLVGCVYRADFVILYPGGKYEVLDAKGFKTKEYRIKKRQMKELYKIEVKEV